MKGKIMETDKKIRDLPHTGASEGEKCLSVLRGLLSYHERVFMENNCVSCAEKCPRLFGGECPSMAMRDDRYRRGLKEAIRCVEIVHGSEITDLHGQ